MREDTNFKGSDSSCHSIYFLFYGSVFTKISIGEKSVTKTLRDYILVWKREIIYQECKRQVQMKTTLIKDDVILHHSRQDEKYER